MSVDKRNVVLRFGVFELQEQSGELRKNGTSMRLAPQPFRILCMLATRAGEVVTREEIRNEIWGETFVDYEQSINTAIRQIRSALNDDPDASRFLQTLPRRGYRFVAPVEVVDLHPEPLASSPAPSHSAIETLADSAMAPASSHEPNDAAVGSARRRGHPTVAIITALTMVLLIGCVGWLYMSPDRPRTSAMNARRRVVAVMPFTTVAGQPLADRAFTEDMATALAEIQPENFAILDPNAAGVYTKKSGATASDQARQLGADFLVEGSIEQFPSSVRVQVSAIDAATKTRLWSESWEQAGGDSRCMPTEVALRTAREFAQHHASIRREPVVLSHVSDAALERYRAIRIEAAKRAGQRDDNKVLAMYEELLRDEPKFAEAWSGLADLCYTLGRQDMQGDWREPFIERSRMAAKQALSIDPELSEAHTILGTIYFQHDHDFSAAEDSYRTAIKGDPEYSDGYLDLAMLQSAMGHQDEAIATFRHAQQLNPVELLPSVSMANLYLYARRYDEALAQYRLVQCTQPQMANAWWGVASVFALEGKWTEAAETIDEIAPRFTTPPVILPTANVSPREHYRQTHLAFVPWYEHAIQSGEANPYGLAILYAHTGENDAALHQLELAANRRLAAMVMLRVDPRFDGLRGDPRYARILERVKLNLGTQ